MQTKDGAINSKSHAKPESLVQLSKEFSPALSKSFHREFKLRLRALLHDKNCRHGHTNTLFIVNITGDIAHAGLKSSLGMFRGRDA